MTFKPYGSGWHKPKHRQYYRPPASDKIGAANEGRRLMPAELAKAAAAMGIPVSGNRYCRDGTGLKRALAYNEAKAKELPPDKILTKRFIRSIKTKHGPRKRQK